MKSAEQQYLEKMFPNGGELPNDRLIPCLLMQGGRTEVILLVKTHSEQAKRLQTEFDSTLLGTDISVTALQQDAGTSSDLRLGLELVYPDEVVRFHGTISDPEGKKQAAVAQALLQVNRIALFVATYDFEFVSFKAFDWNPHSLQELKNTLEDAAKSG